MQSPTVRSVIRSAAVTMAIAWLILPRDQPRGDAAGQPRPQAEATTPAAETSHAGARGLQALYDFREPRGELVKDRSGVGRPAHLTIAEPAAVRREPGSLTVTASTILRTREPPVRLIESIRRSGECTIEAWIRPANLRQQGPARIVTLSANPSNRNVTLGQQADRFEARLRTTKTSNNGIPETRSAAKTVATRTMHVVYTRDRQGQAVIYVDGRSAGKATIEGRLSNWNGTFQLALANEFGRSRPWQGTLYRVAIFNRALDGEEIVQRFEAGHEIEPTLPPAADDSSMVAATQFETRIAPLLANHCLECHDASTAEGGLDLSTRAAALAGGDSGPTLVGGDLQASSLWERVAADEMPHDRPALSADEKALLKDWILGGATWSLDRIDPALYVHAGRVLENRLRRLTVDEYIDTVRAATGVDIEGEARKILPADIRADGFSNTAYNLNVDLKHVQAYAQLAEIVAARIDAKAFARRFSRSRRLTDDSMRKLIAKMGKWLLRGPIADHEIDVYRGVSTTVASGGGDFDQAVRLVLEAMLQSPRFLYRVERQQGDGSMWPVGQYELASRISYIIWGGPPDEPLMKDADAGRLDHETVARHVERMLDDPRAVEQSTRFLAQWLDLARLDALQPDPQRYPHWTPQLARDMRRETVAFFEEVVWHQQRPLAELLNANVTFATPRLAKHYGLDPTAADSAASEGQEALHRYDLSTVPGRGGILTQASVLTVGGDEASMVARGLFVFHELLRGVVKDPPPCVDTTPQPTRPGLTQRGIASQRIADRSCGGCHGKFEPLAFGLERFDGLGRIHGTDEHGNRLRDDGDVLIPGAARRVPFESSAELMDLLAQSERVAETITWKMTQFAIGRPLLAEDARPVARIHASALQGGGTYRSLIKAIVMSDLVQLTPTEPLP